MCMELDLFEEVSIFVVWHVAPLLHSGQLRYVNIADNVKIIILLTANLTQFFSPNLKFELIGIESAL